MGSHPRRMKRDKSMWEGSYGKEPFDLRLTVLRLIRKADKILVLTLVGTIVFGGGYYVKNVILQSEPAYAATSTYKVQYVEEPTQAGDYYINETSWNTLLDTKEFLDAVQQHLAAGAEAGGFPVEITNEELKEAISAKLPSDWHVPTTTVETNDMQKSLLIGAAVEAAMTEELAETTDEVSSIRVMDPALTATEVKADVRPVRAVILSAVLSLFFAVVVFLLQETGDDSIWLPSTLRRRYGLPVLGTVHSRELQENINYLLKDKKQIAVCSVDVDIDPAEVIGALPGKESALPEEGAVLPVKGSVLSRKGNTLPGEESSLSGEGVSLSGEWTAVPAPLICPESCEVLRKMDGIVLVVRAGRHAGKPLEYVLDYLSQQDCEVTAALLWEADEKLLDAYYMFQKTRE